MRRGMTQSPKALVHSIPGEGDLPREAIRLASDLSEGHYLMGDAVAMIRKLALALDASRRAAQKAAA
jgi:hypothetical protein